MCALNDPEGKQTEWIKKYVEVIKKNFSKAYFGITPRTEVAAAEAVNWYRKDNYFELVFNPSGSQVGEHFRNLFKAVVGKTNKEEVLHIINPDRLIWTLVNDQKIFLEDIKRAENEERPTVFLRSNKAWVGHPQNYRAMEAALMEMGKVLFGQIIDFAWCQITLKANVLSNILTQIRSNDWVAVAEVAYALKDVARLREVDWLGWEDALVAGVDEEKLKKERETDPKEVKKRLGYVIPMMKFILEKYREGER